MKAIVLKGFGGVENLVVTDLQMPPIAEDEVLVEARAIGINPVDVKTRKGKGLAGVLKDFDPVILGWDVSGTITRTGAKVTGFKAGDDVFGMVNFPGHGKAYAEYVAVPEAHLAIKPSQISHEEATAASLAALTAWQVLKYKSGIKAGDKVLIHSAAGGVGHYAVQMAKYLGAHVAGTSSGLNKDFVLQLGASVHIDYEIQKFENIIHDYDFVLDTIGGEYTERSFSVLKHGGTIICIPSGTSENITENASARGLHGYHFRVLSDGHDMQEIADLLGKGIIKSFVSKTFAFSDIKAAHEQIETRKTKGKIVLTVN